MRALVTGATGFIGHALVSELLKQNNTVIAAVRNKTTHMPENALQEKMSGTFELDNIQILKNVDVVIHCAARAHILNENNSDPLKAFRETNTIGTLNLAKQAVIAGVKRFIFISSIGVVGKISNQPFSESDIPNPQGAYAASKYEAEVALLALAEETGLEVVIIRPPLVYGPGAPGNFATLMRLMYQNIPLPLGTIHNKRSFVAIDNLVDLILSCIEHPAAANQIFLAADGDDLSTTELLNRVAFFLKKKIPFIFIQSKIT